MVRAAWFTGLIAAVAQAQLSTTASVSFDTSPQQIGSSNMTLAVVPRVITEDSPLLNTTGLQARKSIDVTVAAAVVGAVSTTVIAAKAAVDLWDNIAAKIKAKSDANSCTPTFGTDSDDGYYDMCHLRGVWSK